MKLIPLWDRKNKNRIYLTLLIKLIFHSEEAGPD